MYILPSQGIFIKLFAVSQTLSNSVIDRVLQYICNPLWLSMQQYVLPQTLIVHECKNCYHKPSVIVHECKNCYHKPSVIVHECKNCYHKPCDCSWRQKLLPQNPLIVRECKICYHKPWLFMNAKSATTNPMLLPIQQPSFKTLVFIYV